LAIMAERNTVGRLLTPRWVFVVLYIAVIFFLSAQPGLKLPGDFLFKDKIAHALEYTGLSLLMFWAARGSWPLTPPSRRVLWTLLAIAGLGVMDELFQSTVPGRDSSPFDWMADLFGACVGQFVSLAVARRRGSA
jgi:VanZ family protein